MNPLISIDQIERRRGTVLAEYFAPDENLPNAEEILKLAQFLKETPDFNLNYLLYGWGQIRKDKLTSFNLNQELVKRGTAKQWDEYLPSFVKNARLRLGVNQYDLAEEMEKTGIYRGKGKTNFIYRIESGLTTFRFVDFMSLVMAVRSLGYPVTFSEIFGEKATAEETNTNLLKQRVELMEAELKQKDEIITRYKELLNS
jgi:transcriptional regulator with XRE-family HTH domain